MTAEATPHTSEAAGELRARRGRGVALPGQRRPWGVWVVGFLGAALFLNALIGQNGYFERQRQEQHYQAERAHLAAMRAENQRLRSDARALKADPATIEDRARRTLGLMKPGEILFIITDAPAPQETPAPPRPDAPAPSTPPPPAR